MAKTGACRTAILPEISGHQLKSALSELRVCLPSEREEYAWTCKMTGEVQHDPSMRSSQGNLTFPEHKARNDLCCEMVPPDTLHSFLLSSNMTIPELLVTQLFAIGSSNWWYHCWRVEEYQSCHQSKKAYSAQRLQIPEDTIARDSAWKLQMAFWDTSHRQPRLDVAGQAHFTNFFCNYPPVLGCRAAYTREDPLVWAWKQTRSDGAGQTA